ncbi:hypothetical protein CIL05_19110 [Virgibacillus profundi]|uniref:CueP family metal-binding protein n=1 Tax=Virgibacillus profundi TaxID=2024555 RepID=A0A2A2I9I4_9BACI|nr:CueP family metal-binding protein [Virgibacillus profundi]PAV27976.1 hypothetical protein CIL05_19110 [Virgibacillus profundi]PXY52154.1 hypothetical protein CIT14_19210 [Virgibacillus profundi]
MKRIISVFTVLVVVGFGVYIYSANGEESVKEESETQDMKQLVNDYSIGEKTSESASITSHDLIVTDSDENQLTYDLPEDEFFVSIAPYVEQTHPCEIHSLTGCQGEMVDEAFSVLIEDMDGNVIVDETMNSMPNGFIDLWLPRDKTFHVEISHNGKTAESEFSTFEGDNTCITTIQLKESSSV